MAKTQEVIEIRHRDGCPANPERVEVYQDTLRTGRRKGWRAEIRRCQDCGAHEVEPLGLDLDFEDEPEDDE